MSILIFFFPAFIPLAIITRYRKVKMDLPELLVTYALFTLVVNLFSFLTLKFISGYGLRYFSDDTISINFAIKYLLLASVISIIAEFVRNYFNRNCSLNFVEGGEQKGKKAFHIIGAILTFVAALLGFSVYWVIATFGTVTADALIFQIKVPLEGTNPDFIYSYIKTALLPAIFISVVFVFIILSPMKKDLQFTMRRTGKTLTLFPFKFIKKHFAKMTACLLVICCLFATFTLDIHSYIYNSLTESSFIEDNYVDPESVSIEFPEEKRNLIYIYLESVETTYYSEELGGAMDVDLIPEISELALENINFSNSTTLGGAYQVTGTGWTIAAMTAHVAGIPLKIPVEENSYGNYDRFLPGVRSLGDILGDEGYNQALVIGSDANFGGRKDLFTQHGNYDIHDYYTGVEDGVVDEDYYVWWGFEDLYLFDYAKDVLTELSEEDEPFNFTMLTADTHHVGGYVCSLCEEDHSEQFSNVISCSSRQLGAFVSWIQEQDFYENTTIVIVGDHLSMDAGYFEDFEDYQRTTVNIFINSAAQADDSVTQNREFTTLDLFPTTLASLGVSIEGDRLGLGTNLFSGMETLVERDGLESVDAELQKKSTFYDEYILYPD